MLESAYDSLAFLTGHDIHPSKDPRSVVRSTKEF